MAKLRNTIYYEFYERIKNTDEFRGEGFEVLGNTTIDTGIDTIPSMNITIPLSAFPDSVLGEGDLLNLEPALHNYIIKVHITLDGVDKYNFQGIVDHLQLDYTNYAANLQLVHRVARMQTSPMPSNYTVKNTPIHHAIGKDGGALGYETDPNQEKMQSSDEPQVYFDFEDDYAKNVTLEMTFGANDKLSALTEAINNTEDLHFYVDLDDPEGDRIVIGRFGDHAQNVPNVIISPYPEYNDDCDEEKEQQYVTMLTEPTYDVEYINHFNRAVVFCGDIEDGVCHLTLEQVYANPTLQNPKFPVKKYEYQLNLQPETEYDDNGKKINNEKIYQEYEIVAFTQNGNREFYVEDTEQLERDNGLVLHTTYQFNDLYPIPKLQTVDEDGDKIELTITDEDRVEIVRRAYIRAIRKLKAQRPDRAYQFNTTALPVGVKDGQYVFFTYSKSIQVPDAECDTIFHKRKIVNVNSNLYLTKRTITFDRNMNEVTTVTLDHELRTRDVSEAELELREKAAEASDVDMSQTYASSARDTRQRAISQIVGANPTRRI